MRNLEWNDGAPEKLQAGMILEYQPGFMSIVGSEFCVTLDSSTFVHASRWAWLIQPYQVEWLESMAKAHKVKSRGE